MNANKIVIPCRLSYANIWEPKQVNGTGDPKYSCCLLIPKSDTETVQRLQAMIERIKKDPVALAKWGGKLPPEKSFKSPLRDGDEERDDENYAGCYFINANANEKHHPRIIDRQCNDVLDQDEVYSGCYAKVRVFLSTPYRTMKTTTTVWSGSMCWKAAGICGTKSWRSWRTTTLTPRCSFPASKW